MNSKVSDGLNPSLAKRRGELEGDVIDDFLAADGLYIVPDEAGVGKTTSVSRGLVNLSERVFFAVERHEKALELPGPPDGYYHVRGRTQPRKPLCVLGECDHEHDRDCPRMCPEYPDPTPEFRRCEKIFSHKEAHRRVDGTKRDCPYLEAREERDTHDKIVGVHHQLTEFSDRIAVIDETPTVDIFEETFTTADLDRAGRALRSIPDAEWLASWVDALREDIAHNDDVTLGVAPPEYEATAEELARLKVEFNDSVIYGYLPLEPCFDAILGALATVGYEPEACCAAIDGPDTLEYCPHCHAPTQGDPPECPNCFWEAGRFDILDAYRESYSRVTAHADGDRLVYTAIPAVGDLPDRVMVLDATARPEIVGALFGVDPGDITVCEPPDVEPNMHVMEISNGQYHASTIAGDKGAPLRRKIQRAIDYADREHEGVLYAIKRSLEGYFDIPEQGNIVKNYHALRGMNVQDHFEGKDDIAVCLIGAPHPHIEKQAHVVRALGFEADESEFYEERPVVVDGEEISVETKAYPGLLGEFFESDRSDELVQTVHRVRPILAEEPIHVYKLTSVPTRLPVDERLTWKEFLYAGLPARAVRELVVPLCEAFDGERAETSMAEIYDIVGADGSTSKRRIRRWVGRLGNEGIAEIYPKPGRATTRVELRMDQIREIA